MDERLKVTANDLIDRNKRVKDRKGFDEVRELLDDLRTGVSFSTKADELSEDGISFLVKRGFLVESELDGYLIIIPMTSSRDLTSPPSLRTLTTRDVTARDLRGKVVDNFLKDNPSLIRKLNDELKIVLLSDEIFSEIKIPITVKLESVDVLLTYLRSLGYVASVENTNLEDDMMTATLILGLE